MPHTNIAEILADELKLRKVQVTAVIQLLDEGATVPFIARYRKEVTGGVDDIQLRNLVERLQYLRELEDRRTVIINTIEEQGKLTPELQERILSASDKTTLEDLYLPYKPKRRTKAQIAREAGLEPLALQILQNPQLDPAIAATAFINTEKDIADAAAALAGAKEILLEKFSEEADLLRELRQYFWQHGVLSSQVVKDKAEVGVKFSDYFDFSQPIQKIPSHRALALFRGSQQEILRLKLGFTEAGDDEHCHQLIAQHFNIARLNRAADAWLWQAVEWAWKIKIQTKLELELLNELRAIAEDEAIRVFKDNLHQLLMAAPAGQRVTLGLDPGLRTGVKVVVVDSTGKLLTHTTIFPHAPRDQWEESLQILAKLCQTFRVELISIGNGTASRETDQLVAELFKRHPDFKCQKIVVSEAGASVYSASALAAAEFPDLDVTYRGAISIARRLQDPLAELVKIDPKSIGVGQYQHDVNQVKLGQSLSAVLEDCVNAVGANVNSASVPLLKSIAGLNENVAKQIVLYREGHGPFKNRSEIKKVSRLGEKTYQQAIGFLRIIGGDNPLDASAVHPESYPVVDQIINAVKKPIQALMGNNELLNSLNPQQFVSGDFGLPTIKDILSELKKPGRDPRPEFKAVVFKEGVHSIEHLKPGMILEGVVTNVANFGAFVDVGVHQDGLVHISQVANHYVGDIHKVIKVGDIVKVKVIEIDLPRKRINLTMKLALETTKNAPSPKRNVSAPPPAASKKPVNASLLGEKLHAALKKPK
jgi:protein Tex